MGFNSGFKGLRHQAPVTYRCISATLHRARSQNSSQLRMWEPQIFLMWCHLVFSYITLADFQIDAQNSYLFIYNTFIKILYMFRALPCSSSGSLRRSCTYVAPGIVTLCRWLSCAPVEKELQFFLNRCTGQSPAESDDTRGCMYTITT